MAYRAVIALGYTHSKLKEANSSVNYPTLRNIRDGRILKPCTERYYLKFFVGLIEKEYQHRLENDGEGNRRLLIIMKNILMAELNE